MAAWLQIHVQNVVWKDVADICLEECPLCVGLSVRGMESFGDNPATANQNGTHESAVAHPTLTETREFDTPVHEGGVGHRLDDRGHIENRLVVLLFCSYHCFATIASCLLDFV